jgi:hypothetical protein
MPVIADRPDLVGFFSCAPEEDEGAKAGLWALRSAILRELSAQAGRCGRNVRILRNEHPVAPGVLWKWRVKTAIAQSGFFIPVVSPNAVSSAQWRFEFTCFLRREKSLGRSGLIFPILYLPVPGMAQAWWRKDAILSIIVERGFVDWRRFRDVETYSVAMREAVERFCAAILPEILWLPGMPLGARKLWPPQAERGTGGFVLAQVPEPSVLGP